MFEQEVTLNRFLMDGFQRIAADVPAERIGERAPGNGHPPVWILGHLEICAELGQQIFGKELRNPSWPAIFGPGSSDAVEDVDQYDKDKMVSLVIDEYAALCKMCQGAAPKPLQAPHGIGILDNSPIVTLQDLLSHLLTSHFAFHLAQLSAWRRADGHGPLF